MSRLHHGRADIDLRDGRFVYTGAWTEHDVVFIPDAPPPMPEISDERYAAWAAVPDTPEAIGIPRPRREEDAL